MSTAEDRLERLDRELEHALAKSHEAVYRVAVLSASIVAFSATLLSIEQLDLDVKETLLGVSWCLFASVVVIGPLSIAIEARTQFIIAWRSIQPQHFDGERRPTVGERLKLWGVLAYTVAIRPRNLIFARDTDFSPTKPTQGMWMNFRMVILANKLRDFALALELLTWGFFSAGVIVLIVAFFP